MALLNKKTQKRLKSYLTNKYFISLIAVIIWVIFFDKDDLLSQRQLRNKLHQLQEEKKYYQQEIEKNKEDINELKTNPENLEKFAREKYLMKKENEEIFVIIKDSL
ncbi:MAG TPA: septum formation initiator family protein [Bacteroidia bacterium]|jgi:cell division protein FtsB|nr:septum formation initiator family protein [Bacteroidia bacterium]